MFIDPIESTGRLNESVMNKLCLLQRAAKTVFPLKISVFCQLMECPQIHRLFHVDDKVPYGIPNIVNQFSTSHQQDIHLCSYETSPLSEPVHVYDLDLNSETVIRSEKVLKHDFQVKVSQSGNAHLLVYWFQLNYGKTKIITYDPQKESLHYKQSMITFKEPIRAIENLNLTFMYHKGLMDFCIQNDNS